MCTPISALAVSSAIEECLKFLCVIMSVRKRLNCIPRTTSKRIKYLMQYRPQTFGEHLHLCYATFTMYLSTYVMYRYIQGHLYAYACTRKLSMHTPVHVNYQTIVRTLQALVRNLLLLWRLSPQLVSVHKHFHTVIHNAIHIMSTYNS